MKTQSILLVVFAIIAFTNIQAEELPKVEETLVLDTSTEFQNIKVASKFPMGLKTVVIEKLSYPTFPLDCDAE